MVSRVVIMHRTDVILVFMDTMLREGEKMGSCNTVGTLRPWRIRTKSGLRNTEKVFQLVSEKWLRVSQRTIGRR